MPVNTPLKTADRRARRRFPLSLPAIYGIHGPNWAHHTTQTVDISSNGVAFKTHQRLSPGTLVRLSIRWPEQRLGQGATHLMIGATVVRSTEGVAAAMINRYEFETPVNAVKAAS